MGGGFTGLGGLTGLAQQTLEMTNLPTLIPDLTPDPYCGVHGRLL